VCLAQHVTSIGKASEQPCRSQRNCSCDQSLVAGNGASAAGEVICTEQIPADRSHHQFICRGRALSRRLVARREQRPQEALRSKVVIAMDITSSFFILNSPWST